jgi:hypothetical protein
MERHDEERVWLITVPLLIRERFLKPLDVLALSLTNPFLRSLTHEHGVCSACDDSQEDGVVWKTTVWSKKMSERMYLNGILRSDIVICIPQDTCRHCGDAKATRLLRGWWIEDEPPNDFSIPTPSCNADVERMLYVEWPAFADCIHQKLMPVKQIASGTVPVCASCLLVVGYENVPNRRYYYPTSPLILGRSFHYSQDHQPIEGLQDC